jgi:predicted site-specific integrase-resolvase
MEIVDLRRAVQTFPVSIGTLRAWMREGKLPGFKLGGKIYMRKRDIEKLLLSNRWSRPERRP